MSEEVKFTEEELNQVKEIQDEYFEIQNTLGQLQVTRIRFDNQFVQLNDKEDEARKKFIDNQTKENKFLQSIREKYGDGSLDPDTGLFTPNKSK